MTQHFYKKIFIIGVLYSTQQIIFDFLNFYFLLIINKKTIYIYQKNSRVTFQLSSI